MKWDVWVGSPRIPMVGKVWDSAILRQKWFHLIVVEFGNFGLPVDGIPMVWGDG